MMRSVATERLTRHSIFCPRSTPVRMSDMVVAVAIFGVAFVAFCIWLAARLVNRGGKRGRRFWIVAALLLPLLYVATFGPVCWWVCKLSRDGDAESPFIIGSPFIPLGRITVDGPFFLSRPLCKYAAWGIPEGYITYVPYDTTTLHGIAVQIASRSRFRTLPGNRRKSGSVGRRFLMARIVAAIDAPDDCQNQKQPRRDDRGCNDIREIAQHRH